MNPNRGLDAVYLTVLGTSADSVDSGEVGRGNKANRVISPSRPAGAEAIAGKNPVSHIGKIYNALSFKMADEIHTSISSVDEVIVWMYSVISRPVNDPKAIVVEPLLKEDKTLSEPDKKQIQKIISENLVNMDKFCMDLVSEKIPVQAAHADGVHRRQAGDPDGVPAGRHVGAGAPAAVAAVLFAVSFTFLRANLFLFPAITLASLVQVLVSSFTMLALSSLSNSSRYVAILYAGAVFFMQALYGVLMAITGSTAISWISFTANMAQVIDVIFRMKPRYDTPVAVSMLVIIGLIVVSASVLERRVRGVEVVT